MTTKYFEPTEYEEMLIAAGWVTAESLDSDYVEYQRSADDVLGYECWLDLRREWDSLDSLYMGMINPVGASIAVSGISAAENKLVRRMMEIEAQLGY